MAPAEQQQSQPFAEGILLSRGPDVSYRVGRLLQKSPSSHLYELSDISGRALVLKAYRGEAGSSEAAQLQCWGECQLMQRIRHPHVLALWDAFLCDSVPCLVLDRADGNLENWLRVHGPLTDRAVIDLARQLLAGLEAIHTAGIVHLDLLPPNVLVKEGPRPGEAPMLLIGDFGISVLLESGERLSRPDEDWAHLPPELLTSEPVQPTAGCDLYSLGLTLMRARLGGLPLDNDSPRDEVERRVLAGEMARAAEGLASPLGGFLASLLHVDPRQRLGSARAARTRLQALEMHV